MKTQSNQTSVNSNTAKMIYESPVVARMILGKLQKKNPAEKYDMIAVTGGTQIVRIKQLPASAMFGKPIPFKVAGGVPGGDKMAFDPKEVFVLKADVGMTVEFTGLEFERETSKWVYFVDMVGSGPRWVHKSDIVKHDPAFTTISIPKKVAIKKGYVAA